MGLYVEIYRFPLGDCTNGGISSKAKGLCIVNVDGPFEPSADYPAARLVKRPFGNIVVEPVEQPEGMCGPMAGGNIADTSDSRFCRAVEKLSGYAHSFPVAIHDRFETWQNYELLSR